MITVDQLFAEDFEPPWLREKKRLVRESLEQAVTVETNYKYQMAAKESRLSIAARVDKRGNYTNGTICRKSRKWSHKDRSLFV